MYRLSKIFEKVLFILTVILAVFIPLYPKLPLLNVKGTFVAIRIDDLLIAFTLIWWVIYLLVSRKVWLFLKNNFFQSILLFFFIGALSIFSAKFITSTVDFHLAIFHYLRRVELMLLLPTAYFAINSKKQAKVILVIFSIVLFLVNVYGLGQRYLGWPVISTTNSEFSKGLLLYLVPGARVNSTFAGHYDLAVFLVMAIVLVATLFFYVRNIFWRFWLIFLFVFSFVTLVFTAARLSFVAVIVGVMVSVFLVGKRLFILIIIILTALALIYPSQLRDRLISTVTVNLFHEGQRYTSENLTQKQQNNLNIPTLNTKISSSSALAFKSASEASGVASDIAPGEPVNSTQLGVYRSFEIRLNQEWPRAIRAFIKNPLLGTGYSSIGLATDNDILRSFAEVGLLGTISFVLIIVMVLKNLYPTFRSQNKFVKFFTAGVISLIIAFFINATFIDVFESSKIAALFWLILGVNLGLRKDKDE